MCHEHSAVSQFFLLVYSVPRALGIQPVLSSGIQCVTSIQPVLSSGIHCATSIQPVLSSGIQCVTSIQHSAISLVVWSAGLSDEIFAVDWKLKGTEVRHKSARQHRQWEISFIRLLQLVVLSALIQTVLFSKHVVVLSTLSEPVIFSNHVVFSFFCQHVFKQHLFQPCSCSVSMDSNSAGLSSVCFM